MSRGYRVTWLTQSRTVTASDHCKLDIDLLGILPEGDMVDLLRAQLEASGWKRKGQNLELAVGEVVAALSEDGRSVEIRLQATARASGRGFTQEEASDRADRDAAALKGQLEKEVAQKLMRAEPAVREKINAVLKEVYVEALKRKAQTLGALQSVQETQTADGEIEVTIKVRA